MYLGKNSEKCSSLLYVCSMKNYKSIAEEYRDALQELYDNEEAKQLFLMAFSSLTGKATIHYGLMQLEPATEVLEASFAEIREELRRGRPMQHILGKADFYGYTFEVNAHTLIPRPETEELVQLIVQENKDNQGALLDIGTGSGCIAISLKKELPQFAVTALDVSAEAIAVARRNSKALAADVEFILADILEWDSFFQAEQRYDVIVSNPPYITPKEQEQMHRNVLNFEPHSALFVEEHAPLLFYDAIAELAKAHLNPNGALYFEINQYLGTEMVDLLVKKGFTDVKLLQDINAVDRMVSARLK